MIENVGYGKLPSLLLPYHTGLLLVALYAKHLILNDMVQKNQPLIFQRQQDIGIDRRNISREVYPEYAENNDH